MCIRPTLNSSNQHAYDHVMKVAKNPETPSQLSEAIYKAHSIDPDGLEGLLSFVEKYDVLYPFAKRPVDDLTTMELGKHIMETCTQADIELAYMREQMDSIVKTPMKKDFAKKMVRDHHLENIGALKELNTYLASEIEKVEGNIHDKSK